MMMSVRVAVVVRRGRLIGIRAGALGVVVVAHLRGADLVLEPQELLAILAQLAIHVVGAVEDLPHPLGERIEYQGVVVEVGRLEEFDVGVACGMTWSVWA